MSDVISNMTGPQLIGFVSVVGGLLTFLTVAVTVIAVPYLTAARRFVAVVQLKRDLVAAGYSADDIERVVRAGADQATLDPDMAAR